MKPTATTITAVHRLQKNREKLIAAFLQKGNIYDFLSKHATFLDQYFIECFEQSLIGPRMNFHKKPYAMIALGGYGRQEQCLHSDIDFLLLFKKNVPPESEQLIQEIIYPLWDLGFEVGHATRSIKDCLSLAANDFDVLTALLDARFLCGMSTLYTELRERLNNYLTDARAKKVVSALITSNTDRHEHFGDSSYLLEPNLKEGQGGLRDYHTMLWIGRITANIIQPRDLEYNGYLSHEEYKELETALAFIWNVRNHLHALTQRKSDQLFLEHQEKIADTLKFKKGHGQLAVERFLGKLHEHLEYVKQTNLIFLLEAGQDRKQKFRRLAAVKRSTTSGLIVNNNMLNFTSPEQVLAEPVLLIKIFEESARLQLPISSEARRIIKDFLHLIDNRFRCDSANVRTFERILVTPADTFNVLNEMLKTGVLVRLIPKMKSIVNRIQYDGYHLYPVDRHSLKAVKIIKKFSGSKSGDPLYADLYKHLGQHKRLLLWAALLHDIGKGEAGRGHTDRGAKLAAQIMTDFGYDLNAVETVSFLIENHLFLIKIATRRDLSDEETAIYCARRIKEARRLKMLYLLTVADSMATGPKAWNDWTAQLLRDLFFKTLKIIETKELASPKAMAAVATKKQVILDSAASRQTRDELAAHLDNLSPRYLLYAGLPDLLSHKRLYQELKDNPFTWDISSEENLQARTVTICAKDRPGLFSKIAGVFALTGLDILKADIFTWKNHIALDIFIVRPPADLIYEAERWEKVSDHLKSALNEKLDPATSLSLEEARSDNKCQYANRPHRITIDNQTSSFFTIIEIIAYDCPGLLFHITDALFRQGLDVRIAKIATKIDQVVDVFYVRDVDGQKIENADRIDAVRDAIEIILPSAMTLTA